MKDGILLLNKPQNWTSSDCVAICRRALRCKGIKKVGHGGTLDPNATGVLPIFVGQATRIMEYMDLDYKTYRCEARLGMRTDTLDIWGEVLEEAGYDGITEEEVRQALSGFNGTIEQLPPKYSAVRINGKRLYEYAYKGEEIDVDIKPRKVTVRKLDILDIDMADGKVVFTVECSKGTYIRTICSDLGDILGCGCTMTALERTAVGNLSLEKDEWISPLDVKDMLNEACDNNPEGAEVLSLDEIAQKLEDMFIAPDHPLVALGRAEMADDRAVYFSRGNSILWWQIKVLSEPDMEYLKMSGKALKADSDGDVIPVNARGRSYDLIYKVYNSETGQFLGTGYYDRDAGVLKADKVFVEKR